MDYVQVHLLAAVDRPKLIAPAPQPVYPPKALAEAAYGKVKVSLCIDETGKAL